MRPACHQPTQPPAHLPAPRPAASAHRYGSGRAAPPPPGALEGSLGVLLLDFLRLYGRALNNIEVGWGRSGGGG